MRDDDRRARGSDAAAHRRRLAAGLLVADLAQTRTLRHQPPQFGLGAVGRAVIDVNDLERPLAVERGGDFGDQRRDITGLVADRHDDGDGRVTALISVISADTSAPVAEWQPGRAPPSAPRASY